MDGSDGSDDTVSEQSACPRVIEGQGMWR